ncbi:DUF805 domain-containing protein [Sphingomonas sanguinis]|uniref:DUF805 domain-containing protein n=1 Tax=Sphingomonas sanguinis TaxID=33051 RepID=A0A147JCN8_9SPHN|nr:DUF805 domain-containing protein [Sphingomonas sanguinis]KTW17714.1 hypothetical protein NS258_01610 [Sphingomonas sanguinis]
MSNRQKTEILRGLGWFFSTKGRAGPIRFMAVVLAMVVVVSLVVWGFVALDAATYPILGALAGAALAKLFAEAGRRCHDLGRRATLGAVVLIGALGAVLSILSLLIVGATAIGIGVVVALVFVFTFLRPGQSGANSYGAPPPGPLQVSRPDAELVDRGSLAWAGVSILGCAAIGLAIQTTTDSIRADRESRYTFSIGSLAVAGVMEG